MRSTPDVPSASPDEVLAEAIEPGERILWAGRPDVRALLAGVQTRTGHRPVAVSVVMVAVLVVGGGAVALGALGPDAGDAVGRALSDGGWVWLAVALGITVAAPLLGRRQARSARHSHERWARALTYGITDRRLLIVEGTEITWELEPDELGPIRLRERTPTHADVEFRELPESSSSRRKGHEALLARDRRRIGFKALPEAERIRQVVERWRDAHREGAERQIADFLEEHPSRYADASETGTVVVRTFSNSRYGLTVSFPEEWDVKVRRRRKAYGSFSLDFERWASPDETSDWNVIRAEGPFHTRVEIHLDAVPEPVATLDQIQSSIFYKLFGGEVVDSSSSVEVGRFRGFSVTRGYVQHGPDQSALDIDRPALIRRAVLHDGRIQVGIVTIWPEGSEPLRKAVEKVVDEMALDELDAEALEMLPEADRSAGCLVNLVRGARVAFGGLVFTVAVWGAADQTARAAESGGGGSAGWVPYAIVGLMLMLRPLLLALGLFPGLTRAPFLRRIAMTFGIAVAVVLAIAVVV